MSLRWTRLLLAGATLACSLHVGAQPTWPARPITVIEPFAAGGAVDTAVRAIVEQAAPAIGQNFIVEARPGAGTRIGTEAILRAPKDGHTIGVMVSASGVNIPALDPRASYDPTRDFTLLTIAFDANFLIVAHPGSNIRSIADLIASGRRSPPPAYGSSGIGTSAHLWVEVFQVATQTRFTHVPYKGESASLQDLIGGQTQFTFANPSLAKPHVDSGKLIALGYASTERSKLYPAVPTVSEAGVPGFNAGGWVAFVGPAGLPREVAARLSAALREAVRSQAVVARLTTAGFNLRASTPDEFLQQMTAEIAQLREVGRVTGITLKD